LKTELRRPQDVERGARDLLKMGCNAVIIKGGHILSDEKDTSVELKATLAYALDYLLTNEECPVEGDERLCDGDKGVWLRTSR
jgi:hydroxymethylpyrimidine/phosphomethylpyrimidine kinase